MILHIGLDSLPIPGSAAVIGIASLFGLRAVLDRELNSTILNVASI